MKLKKLDHIVNDQLGRASFNIGMGKPEPLPHKNKGYCTRRYDHEHRLIYKIEGKHIQFVKYRFQ